MAIQRLYKPQLDEPGLTYPQYLVLNVLWRDDDQTVGGIAFRLALESSTLTPLFKRLEEAGLIMRMRIPRNERQVLVPLTDACRDLRARAGCLWDALLGASDMSASDLARLNRDIRKLRDQIYRYLDDWEAPV
jgi:DNA-binding MarR family transcriptional regulator